MIKMESAFVVDNFSSNLYPYEVVVKVYDTDTDTTYEEVEGMFETYGAAYDFALEVNMNIGIVKGDLALYYATFS